MSNKKKLREENIEAAEEEVVQEDTEETEQAEEAAQGENDSVEKKEEEEGKPSKKDKNTEKIEALQDKMMRTMAEFENFRKRSEKEKTQMFEIGAKSVIEKVLPVLDNFERGLAGLSEEEAKQPFAEGMQMVYKQMQMAFEEMGVTPIEAVGKEFDPNLHNAVMTVEDEEMESNTVCEELQKGYMYKDTVVRHSMVKVVS